MPTIFIIKGFRFYFYSNENDEPIHIHVVKADATSKYWLSSEIKEEYSYGFSTKQKKDIEQIIKQHLDTIKKPGMNTSNKTINKKATDPLDVLIFERKLRVKQLVIFKDLDMMLAVFNNSSVIKLKISDYPKLKKASKKQLENWKIIAGGIGIRWEQLDEDLSIKGFIKAAALSNIIDNLRGEGYQERNVA